MDSNSEQKRKCGFVSFMNFNSELETLSPTNKPTEEGRTGGRRDDGDSCAVVSTLVCYILLKEDLDTFTLCQHRFRQKVVSRSTHKNLVEKSLNFIYLYEQIVPNQMSSGWEK